MNVSLRAQLEQAKSSLEDAYIAHCGAMAAHAEAERALELTAAQRLCESLEGADKEQREAKLQLELTALYGTLGETEDDLMETKCALELARLEWELARYRLRFFNGGTSEAAV